MVSSVFTKENNINIVQSYMKTIVLELVVGMRLFFIYAYAVAVYADLYDEHIRMKPHRKCGHADIRIYADKPHMFI